MVEPLRPITSAYRRAKPGIFQGEVIARDGQAIKTVRYEPVGHLNPPTVLFLHGITTSTETPEYDVLFSALREKGFRVISFDQRGHGSSKAEFNVEHMKSDVVDVLKALKDENINSVHIGAHSLGGVIAAAGLVQAHQENASVPAIEGFFSFAPPPDLKETPAIRAISLKLAAMRKKRPKLLKALPFLMNPGASLAYALGNSRFRTLAHKANVIAKAAFSWRGITADQLRLLTPEQFITQVKAVPNFIETMQKLNSTSSRPEYTAVILGTKDHVIGTHRESVRREYAAKLQNAGVQKVYEWEYPHDPPWIGHGDIYSLSKQIADLVAREYRVKEALAKRAKRRSRTSLPSAPPEKK